MKFQFAIPLRRRRELRVTLTGWDTAVFYAVWSCILAGLMWSEVLLFYWWWHNAAVLPVR